MVLHTCTICSKDFARKNDLERHKNRKNKCTSINIDVTDIINNIPHNTHKLPQYVKNTTQIPHEPHEILQSKTDCKKCNKKFSRLDSLKRHQLFYCLPKEDVKEINNKDNTIIELLQQMKEEHKQEILELKNTINELKASSSANITNNNTNSNNTTNVTNNNIKIVAFGYENPIEALDDKEIQFIIGSHKNTMIQRSIKTTHFNNRLPQFHNVYIPDKKMQHAITFNGNKPEMKGLEGVIDDLLLTHINNLDDIKNRENVSITEAKAAEIDDVVDNFRGYKDTGSENQKWIYKKAEREIKEMLYNNKEKVIDTQKRAKKRKGIKV